MYSFTRSKLFWAGLVVATAVSGFILKKYLPESHKIIHIDLRMSQKEARNYAAALSKKFHLSPADYQVATIFKNDQETQFFVELECGGCDVFVDMMRKHLYEPYTWQVRHFKENNSHEALFLFTPSGDPYGFKITLPENEPGTNLTTQEAQKQAEQEAFEHWNIDFSLYKFFQNAQNETVSGRINHIFVYQREDETLGAEGRYRVEIVISGNKLTAVLPCIDIPESFTRRYEELRAGNETIAYAGHFLYLILYLFLGGIVGGFFLFRKKQLFIPQAAIASFIIAGLYAASTLNELPLFWMQYNTATSHTIFLLKFLLHVGSSFFYHFFVLFISIVAGEGLTRLAFPSLPQLWKNWSFPNAASPTIVGATLAGYCGAVITLACSTLMYRVFIYSWNWWTPGSTLIDPNILATPLPWLSSLAQSLFAGVQEEFAYRAIPLAGAGLIGRYFNKEKQWIFGALILQALIFGACHANYQTIPSYLRIVEMFGDSVVFGILYMRYGLLLVILIHWLYDFLLMSLPIFVSHASGGCTQQILVVFFACVPLLVILYQRMKSGMWKELLPNTYNSRWTPPTENKNDYVTDTEHTITVITKKEKITLATLGICGLIMWVFFTQFSSCVPQLTIQKKEAVALARAYLQREDPIFLKTATFLATPPNLKDDFSWQELGETWYKKLQGSYVQTPYWSVRAVHFEGDLLEKAEEYCIFVNNNGVIEPVNHTLPEQKKGEQLSQKEAGEIARQKMKSLYNLDSTSFKEVSATMKQKPQRRDWLFVFEDTSITLPSGIPWITIGVSGDAISYFNQSIHAPEQWARNETQKNVIRETASSFFYLLCMLLWALGLAGILMHFRNYAYLKLFVILALVLTATFYLQLFLYFPVIVADFTTAQPFFSQTLMAFIGYSYSTLPRVFCLAVLIFLIHKNFRKSSIQEYATLPVLMMATGAFMRGLLALGISLCPALQPNSGSYELVGTVWPLGSLLLKTLFSFMWTNSLLFLCWSSYSLLTNHWTTRKYRGGICMIMTGIFLVGYLYTDSIEMVLITGSLLGVGIVVLYSLLIYKDQTLIPLTVSGYYALKNIEEALLNPYPSAWISYSITSFIVLLAGYLWFKILKKNNSQQSSS